MTKPRHSHTIEQIKNICDQAGIKLTPQRLEIFRELVSTMDHPSVEEVYERLQRRLPTVAKDTVYRTLATFDELGIARKLHLSSKITLLDTNTSPHHHFICDSCQKVEDLNWPEFDNTELPEEFADIGQIRSRHLELHGICNSCRQKNGK